MKKDIVPMDRRSQLLTQLRDRERDPFAEILSDFMGAAPEPDRLKEFAYDNPDKWVKAVEVLAKLVGYADRTEQVNLTLDLGRMSDSQIQERMLEMLASNPALKEQVGDLVMLSRPRFPIIDAVVEEITYESEK